jgi:hypothetical protein
MDSNLFFRFLGRVNTVLITLAGIVVLIAFISSEMWFLPFEGGRRGGQLIEPEDRFRLAAVTERPIDSTFTVPDGWSEAVMMLQRGGLPYRDIGLSSSGRVREDGANILLIDMISAKTRWLFAGTARDISYTSFVHGPKTAALVDGPVTALLLAVADADTNHDGEIDNRDDDALYVYKEGAVAPAKILSTHIIWSIRQLDAGHVIVAYNDGKAERMALFSTGDYRLLSSISLPTFPH